MYRDQLQIQQRRKAKKLKEKASMAPMASPSIQEGKSELAIQGEHSKTQFEWKNHEKAEIGVREGEKPESRGKMA